jgi:epsilon-lactone hydrolase
MLRRVPTSRSEARTYEIRILGPLGPIPLSAFPGMSATRSGSSTVLTGVLTDRSALYGVIAEIEALGLGLLELRCTTSGLAL